MVEETFLYKYFEREESRRLACVSQFLGGHVNSKILSYVYILFALQNLHNETKLKFAVSIYNTHCTIFLPHVCLTTENQLLP